jgi:GntR family transcriptional repressor for pyruvate dehydrogenase complex
MLTPIRRQSLSDAVYEQLKTRIVQGDLPAGEPLPAERALCAALGVNRGALREALKRLEQAGLVNIQHGGGTKVTDFMATAGLELLPELMFGAGGAVDVAVAQSVVEMRSALAHDLARRAAARRADADADALDAVVAEMAAVPPGELLALQRLAMTFWGRAVAASGNVADRLAFNTLARAYAPIFELLTQCLADELADLAGYRALAAAIRARRPDEAAAHAQALTARGEAGLLRVLAALGALQAAPNP